MRAQARETAVLRGWRLELEITGRCQLQCLHCYAGGGCHAGSASEIHSAKVWSGEASGVQIIITTSSHGLLKAAQPTRIGKPGSDGCVIGWTIWTAM
jgi:hypothetical protein